jgi:signal transduction histidine kinase
MRLGNLMPRLSSGNVDLLLEFIRSGYRIIERESQELSRNAEVMVFLGSLTGVIQDGSLCRISRLGRADLNPVALNMNRLLDGVIATLKTQAGQVGVTFEIGELPPFRGDDDGHAELVQRNLVEAMIHADAVQLRQAHVLSELC